MAMPGTPVAHPSKENNSPAKPNAIKRAIDRGFANRDGDLMNEGDDKVQTQGGNLKKDRALAMARRLGKKVSVEKHAALSKDTEAVQIQD